jgi:gluconate 2-dehydrogenase gamma chain
MSSNKHDLSRRDLLSAGAALGSAVVLSARPTNARSISGKVPWEPGEANAPTPTFPGDYQFWTVDEALFMDAAVARLIPNDQLGAGAKEAGVTTFIDRQLAGAYGRAQSWYMQGPWPHGSETQGYQSRLTPAQLYRTAIRAIDGHCRQDLKTAFATLTNNDQDRILGNLEKGSIELDNVDGKVFFEMLLQNTLEGFFSDPMYGGNRDMVGWKLIGFPGARYDYRPFVLKHGERLSLQPVGLMGSPRRHD